MKIISLFFFFFEYLVTRERTMSLIKDICPINVSMAIRGGCISIWRSHKFNEEHDPYNLDCAFQDEEVVLI